MIKHVGYTCTCKFNSLNLMLKRMNSNQNSCMVKMKVNLMYLLNTYFRKSNKPKRNTCGKTMHLNHSKYLIYKISDPVQGRGVIWRVTTLTGCWRTPTTTSIGTGWRGFCGTRHSCPPSRNSQWCHSRSSCSQRLALRTTWGTWWPMDFLLLLR